MPDIYSPQQAAKIANNNQYVYPTFGWTNSLGHNLIQQLTMDIAATRAIIDAILDGSVENAGFTPMPVFNFDVPKSLPGIDPHVLNPRASWADKAAYDEGLVRLGRMFVDNFRKFTNTASGRSLERSGPQL